MRNWLRTRKKKTRRKCRRPTKKSPIVLHAGSTHTHSWSGHWYRRLWAGETWLLCACLLYAKPGGSRMMGKFGMPRSGRSAHMPPPDPGQTSSLSLFLFDLLTPFKLRATYCITDGGRTPACATDPQPGPSGFFFLSGPSRDPGESFSLFLFSSF